MKDDLIQKILSGYSSAIDGAPWHNDAVDKLKGVLTSIDKVQVPEGNLDYSKIRGLIIAKNTHAVFEKLKSHLDNRNIKTHDDLVTFVKSREYIDFNCVRDVFCFHGTGASGIKALYTYMNKELNFCPFEDGYRRKELNDNFTHNSQDP